MASKTHKIDAMMNDATCKIDPAHEIGTTRSGKRIYARYNGWSPVAQMDDGTYRPSTGLRLDRDANYIVS